MPAGRRTDRRLLSSEVNRAGSILTRRITTFREIVAGFGIRGSGFGAPGSGFEPRTPQYRRSHEVHRVRIYSRDEIGRALTAAGFTFSMRRSYGASRLLPGDVAVVAERQ